ncbi:MAG: STAS/SEC14 domain-containing protein [Halobacteriaceae archaeon]
MPHYDEPHLTATWDRSLGAVVMDWHEFAQGAPYREGLEAGLELVTEQGATRWLADLREMGTVAEDDQAWTNEQWFPRAIQSDLEYMAIIQPESVVAEMSVDNIMQEVGDGALTTHYFDNRRDAEAWLDEQTATV